MEDPAAAHDIPPCIHLRLMDRISNYMKNCFSAKMNSPDDNAIILPHIGIPTELVCEADRLVGSLIQATKNKVVLQGFQSTSDPFQLSDPAASIDFTLISRPTMIVDDGGLIVAWYLPQSLSTEYQHRIWETLQHLQVSLRRSLTPAYDDRKWRTSRNYFREDAELRGTINLSPAWFQQGRNMRSGNMEVSALLKPERSNQEAREWLKEIAGVQALLSSALSVMHPEMYGLGRKAMTELWRHANEADGRDMADVLELWPTVYNSLSAMVNRCSPHHIDGNGLPQWFDMLLTVGKYEGVHFQMPQIHLAFAYPPGTLLAFSGKMLEHGVAEVDGDRACIAWYMQKKVYEALDVRTCTYADAGRLWTPT